MRRMLTLCSRVVTVCLCVVSPTEAQQIDVTVFLGRAYPVYDERLTLRPSVPSLPGVEVAVSGDPVIRPDGGLVVGGALAVELGIVGIEARIDGTEVAFDLTGARYDLRATQPPFTGLTGSISVGNGRFDANRFFLLSGNLRIRAPGPIALVASAGLSLLPDVSIGGSIPIAVQISGLPAFPGIEPRLQLRVAPGESQHRIGVNGGAGLRLGGDRIGILAEVRAFYFREYDLRFDVEGAPEFVATLLENADTIRFRPVIVNAQAGLVFRF